MLIKYLDFFFLHVFCSRWCYFVVTEMLYLLPFCVVLWVNMNNMTICMFCILIPTHPKQTTINVVLPTFFYYYYLLTTFSFYVLFFFPSKFRFVPRPFFFFTYFLSINLCFIQSIVFSSLLYSILCNFFFFISRDQNKNILFLIQKEERNKEKLSNRERVS